MTKLLIKAVAFDLFGTLVQIQRPTHPFAQLLARCGGQPEQAAAHRRLIMCRDLGLAGVAHALGADLPLAQLAGVENALHDELASIALFDDTLDVLATLRSKGVRIGIASNLAAPYAIPVRALLPELDFAVWSFKVAAVKPDAAFFQHVIAGAGCAAENILMVGDNPKNDVCGALSVGLQARRIDRAGRAEADVMRSLAEVVKLLPAV